MWYLITRGNIQQISYIPQTEQHSPFGLMLLRLGNVTITVVSRKYAPPFATLALVQNAGGAYMQDATISLAITPSLPKKHDPMSLSVAGGGQGRGIAKCEAERCS